MGYQLQVQVRTQAYVRARTFLRHPYHCTSNRGPLALATSVSACMGPRVSAGPSHPLTRAPRTLTTSLSARVAAYSLNAALVWHGRQRGASDR